VKLVPYDSVDGLPFTASMDDVRQRFGPPWHERRNVVALDELDYGSVVYRFQDNGRLEEVTGEAREVDLGTHVVPFAALSAFLRERDPDCFERAGFLVSPAYGLAVAPDDPPWVTALARHCIGEWRAL
jgi:hypothetical protein